MNAIKHDEFIELIKEANVICIPECGVFYNTKGINPTTKRKFSLPSESDCYMKKLDQGIMLIAKEQQKTFLVGFVLRDIFQWV